jgi:hypothetical protein
VPPAGRVREERRSGPPIQNTPYRDCMTGHDAERLRRQMGYASAAATADFIIPNMVAEAASGRRRRRKPRRARSSGRSAITRL